MVATFFNKPNILKHLIERDADLSIKNNEDKDALEIAIEKDHSECLLLIKKELEKNDGLLTKRNLSNKKYLQSS